MTPLVMVSKVLSYHCEKKLGQYLMLKLQTCSA